MALKILSVCHTVQLFDGVFQAESQDELALLNFAKKSGYNFIEYQGDTVKVQTPERDLSFQVLQMIPFNSDRKRMSFLVKDQNSNIFLFLKGADNVVLQRSQKKLMDGSSIRDFKKHLQASSSKGL